MKKVDIRTLQPIWSVGKVLDMERLQRVETLSNVSCCDCGNVLAATTRGWYCEKCDKALIEE